MTLTDPSGFAPAPEPPRLVEDQVDLQPHAGEPFHSDLLIRCGESVEGAIVLGGLSAVVLAGGATLLAGAGAAGATGGGLIATGALVVGGLELIVIGALASRPQNCCLRSAADRLSKPSLPGSRCSARLRANHHLKVFLGER